MTTESKTEAKVFSFLDEGVRSGTGDLVLPGSEALSGVIKRYAEGGENKIHCHPREDHTFYILEGEATFRLDQDEKVVVAGTHEAVFLPRGTYYWFESSGDTKLIMLRVGTEQRSDRSDLAGAHIPSRRANAERAPVRDLPF
ncbi:MAG: cupin domain-containing protein [Dehalococcoidia bacterium]